MTGREQRSDRRPLRTAAQIATTIAIGVVAILVGLYVLPRLTSVDADGNSKNPSGASSPTRTTTPSPSEPGGPAGAAQQPPTPSATPTPSASPRPGRPSDALAGWARRHARLGIPPVALQAYGYAELEMARTQPRCRLSWTLLAGIGAVESNHGRHRGTVLRQDGTTQPRIMGIQLNGLRSERIADTDDGRLDGDRRFDRAMGPMQFIPATWARWATDADGDRNTDPYDIDDAALTAGRYLCANGRNLALGADWWGAVLSYNNVPRYASMVYAQADRYGRASLGS